MNQHRLLDCFEESQEFAPNLSLVRDGVRPQAVLDGGVAVADAHTDEVVEVAVGQALDIQIDGRAFELEFRAADDVDFLLPNRQRLERVMIFLAFVALPLGPAARAERVGELRDGEDAFAAEFLALLRAHAGQQAEVVLLHRELPAAGLEFALGAVPVQDEIGRRGAGEQRGDFPEAFPHFAGQGQVCTFVTRAGLQLFRFVVFPPFVQPTRSSISFLSAVAEVAVDDFAEADGASEHFGEHERIERQQQLVVLGELVAVDETDGNELRRLAPAGGRNAFDGVEASLNGSSRREEALTDFGRRSLSLVTSAATKLRAHRDVHGQSPFAVLQGFRE